MLNLSIHEIKLIWSTYINEKDKTLLIYPSKRKKQWALLYIISLDFELDRHYSEKEVDAILKTYYEDYVRLRRDMVDYHFFNRTKDGSIYEKQELNL